jgi:competence protein ComFC
MKLLKQISQEISNFIYPNLCFQCHSELEEIDHSYICTSCESFLEIVTSKELIDYHKKYLENLFVQSFIAYYFDDISKKYIHIMKYQHGKSLAQYMGKLIAKRFTENFSKLAIDIVIPCPLFRSKLFERDYNQAEFLVKGLSEFCDLTTNNNLVKRIRKTKTQTKLNKVERQKNLKDAFLVSNEIKQYKNILIVDDVITTGATMKEISRAIIAIHPEANLYACAFACPV